MNRHNNSTDELVPAAVTLKVTDNKPAKELRNSLVYPVGMDYWYKFESGLESQSSSRHPSLSLA